MVPRSAFTQILGHDSAEGPGPASHHVGRVGREFGWKRLCQASTRTKPWDKCGPPANGDLIFRVVSENVLADPRTDTGAVVGGVDVDQPAPSIDEFLVADNSTEPPDGGLFDGELFAVDDGLCVGGDDIEAGRDGIVRCESLDQVQNRENT